MHIVRMVRPVLKALNLSDLPSPGLPKLQALIDKMDDLDAPLMAAKLGDWCFVGGTAVLTLSGPMAIEAVEPGMMVLSAPESGDGRAELRPVTAVHRNIASEIVEITYDHDGERETPDATIESTVGHPYWVEERAAFAPAADLEPGDTLRLASGRMVAITSVTTRSGVRVPVYNFAVADFHTYFAGPGGVWVHNTCDALCEKVFGRLTSIKEDFLKTPGVNADDAYDLAQPKALESLTMSI